MAEFTEVSKNWIRLCKYQYKKHNGIGICVDCPLNDYVNCICNVTPYKEIPEDISIIKTIVMNWAKEHPEPRKPTWLELLVSLGVYNGIRADLYKELGKTVPDDILEALEETK